MIDRLRKALPFVFAVLSSVIIVRSLFQAFQYPGDIPEFYCSSQLLLSGNHTDFYDLKKLSELEATMFPLLHGRFVALILPPPVLIFTGWLALVPLQMVQPFWFGACCVALCACIWKLRRLFSLTRNQLLYSWTVIIVFGATYECVRLGQLGLFLLLFLVSAFCFLKERREWQAALCLSLMVIKPQLLAPAMIFSWAAGKRSLFVKTILFSLLWILLSLVVVGFDGWAAYLQLVSRLNKVPEFIFFNASTICGQLFRLPNIDRSIIVVFSSLLWFCAMGFLFRIGLSFKNREDWLNAMVLSVMPIAAASSLYLMDYDLVILIPSVILLITRKLYAQSSPLATIPVVVLTTILLLPFHFWVRYNYLLKGAVFNPFVAAVVVLCLFLLSIVRRGTVGGSLLEESSKI